MNSLLKQERLNRNWSRAYVEKMTNIPVRSLENWEEGLSFPRDESIKVLCKLYGKTPKELGLDQNDRMGVTTDLCFAPQEGISMSDIVRREVFGNLGSRLTGLIDIWPKRNYHYEELQEGIDKAIIDYNVLVRQDSSYEITRRQAIKDVALVPVQLMGGIALIESGKIKKVDIDILLKHCAAAIAAGWYLRRGKELEFVSGLTSTYLSILQPIVGSHSEAHRKAAATLLAQSFRLKGSIINALKNSDQAIPYYHEAIRYALIAENSTEQAIANRMLAFSYWRRGPSDYEQALFYAQKAYGLVGSNTPRMVRSFTASGLSLCQAVNGQTEDAKISLSEARDCFDGAGTVSSLKYSEAILIAIRANVHQHCGLWQESVDLWEESLAAPDISALGSIQQRINYAKTEVSRDDQDRNMDLCVNLVTEAITGAKALGSQSYQQEARACYNLLHAAWPREDAIKRLGKEHF